MNGQRGFAKKLVFGRHRFEPLRLRGLQRRRQGSRRQSRCESEIGGGGQIQCARANGNVQEKGGRRTVTLVCCFPISQIAKRGRRRFSPTAFHGFDVTEWSKKSLSIVAMAKDISPMFLLRPEWRNSVGISSAVPSATLIMMAFQTSTSAVIAPGFS